MATFILLCSGSSAFASVSVNFQSEFASVPPGYLKDFGLAFGVQGDEGQQSLEYGWVVSGTSTPIDIRSDGRDRNLHADQALDTLMHMALSANVAWEVKLANGTYTVKVSVGDPAYFNSVHGLDVEGVKAIEGFEPSATAPFQQATVTVEVEDGRLTVSGTGTNTKINYIEISPVQLESNPVALTLVNDSGAWSNIAAITDGDPTSAGHKPSSGLEWIEYRLPAKYRLTKARLNEDNAGNWQVEEWNIQLWVQEGWHDAFEFVLTPFAGWHEVTLADAVTDRLRLRLNASYHPEIREFEVYGEPATSLGEVCGNGNLESSEECDDGNTDNGDGCSATCTIEEPLQVCGNGIRELAEECDDGNLSNDDGCSSTCVIEVPVEECGNGKREATESCDDGNLKNGDGCSSICTLEDGSPQSIALVLIADSGWIDAENIIDQNENSAGHKEAENIDWLVFDLGGQYQISHARLNEDNAGSWNIAEWQVQYWSAGGWLDAAPFADTPSAGWHQVDFESPVSERIRLRVQGSAHPEIRAFEIYGIEQEGGMPLCGNAVQDNGEQCDDGNLVNGDGCSSLCIIEQNTINEKLSLNLLDSSGGWNNIGALNDGDVSTAADNDGGDAEWLEYALSSSRRISHTRINEDNAGTWNISDWYLQYWTGTAWRPLFSWQQTPFAGWHEVDFEDVITDRVRLNVRASNHIEAFEFELFGEPEQPCTNNGDADCFRQFHLTARPWMPLQIPRTRYLDRADAVVRNMMQYQNQSGAIIDPNKNQEWQYSTPYFAAAGAVLIDAGRYTPGSDIWNATLKAMDEASRDFSNGRWSIPQDHGEFYSAPLATAYELLSPRVDSGLAQTWRNRLSKPVENTLRGLEHNWRTYAMKGEWLRVKAGLISESSVLGWLESSWNNTQDWRISSDLFLYHDGDPDPQTFAYESVARLNIAAMIDEAYPGSSRNEMLDFVRKGGETAVKFLDPSGEGAANGRSGDHVWNDVVAGAVYERLAEAYAAEGDFERAGRYRRAAMLILKGMDRFLRHDCPNRQTNCDYSVTKNQYPSWEGNRYASYSAMTNYNGYIEYHLTESYQIRETEIEEKPTWSEIGGYAFETDDQLAGAFVNAGGMHMQIALRGQTGNTSFNQWWTALGVSRFSRPGWDSRLGPSNGIRDQHSRIGITFAPTFQRNGNWHRMASIPAEYRADFSAIFVHPLLTRFTLVYRPTSNAPAGSPTFTQDFTVISDGVFTKLHSSSNANFGLTLPLLRDDGATRLITQVSTAVASTRYPGETDEQNYIAIDDSPSLTSTGVVRSGYGDLEAIRYTGANNQVFIYPRSDGDPSSENVRGSFVVTEDGFESSIARVKGEVYIGRTSAGGRADSLDLNGDGVEDINFNRTCNFILQLDNGVVTAAESDLGVVMNYDGRAIELMPYTPFYF